MHGLRTAFEHHPRLEADEILQHHDVGLIPGCDRAEVGKAVVLRRVQGCHHERVLRTNAVCHRDAQHLVDVPLVDEENRLPVIGAEHASLGPVLEDQRKQVDEVASRRSLTEHDPHSQPPFFQRFGVGGALVVGGDAGRDVSVELMSAHPGCMAVDVRGESGVQLGELTSQPGDDAGKVHHLGHPDRPVAPQKSCQVALSEPAAR